MKSIEDILEGGEEAAPAVETQETEARQPAPVAQEEKPAVVRDEGGRFAPKGVDDGAPPAPKQDQLPPEEYKALKEERTKRQTLEQELAQIKQRLDQQPKEPPAPPPSIWDDEQGAFHHFGGQIMQQASLNARLDMSEMLARQNHADFEEVKADFIRLANDNPALADQARADPHPWNKAYQIAKNHKAMQELSAVDVADLEAKLREKIMSEMTAQPPAARLGLPITLSNERNVGNRTGPAWAGPQKIEDILR